jgi:hypothetical protein
MPAKKNKLISYFRRNGYFRVPDKERKENESAQVYKKGYEVRFLAKNREEFNEINRLLKKEGFIRGKHFSKANQTVIPVYGRKAVQKFRQLLSKKQS